MPKATIQIDDFSGGLDAISDARDIKDNQFSKNWNVIVDRKGVLRLAGRGQHEIPASMFSSENFQTGFGLFQFNVDYAMGEFDSNLYDGIETGTIDAFTSTSSFTLENTNSAVSTDDYYNDWTIFIYSGTGAGESRLITDYTGSSRTITCEAFANLDTNSKYIIYRWKTDGTNWIGSAAKKDFITDGTTPIAGIEPYRDDKYYFICKKTSITDEQSVNLGYIEYEPKLTLKAGVTYNLDMNLAFKNNWKNYVCNGSEDGSGTAYGDRPPWIEIFSETVTDGTNTGLSLYADGGWVSKQAQAGYKSLVDANFIDNGDFTGGLADGWAEYDMLSVISSDEEDASDAYGTHDGTLTLSSTSDYDILSGLPESYIYQQLSLDDNTPYHLNFVYGTVNQSSTLLYSVVDVKNVIGTGVVTNLGGTITATGNGLTDGDSLTCAVDGQPATAARLLRQNIYKSDGTFVGLCTAVGSTTQITFGGGVAVDLANDVELFTEKQLIPWTTTRHTGGLTTYKFINFNTSATDKLNTNYVLFNVPAGSGTEANIQIRFAPSKASVNVNIAGVTVHKAFNDLVTMSQNNNGNNPFVGNVLSWSNYSTKFQIPKEYENGGDKSDWVFRIHGGAYGNRTSATNAADNQEVYIGKSSTNSDGGDIITALTDNNSTDSRIALFSNKTKSWDRTKLVWNGLACKPVYNYINGMLKISDGNFNNNNTNKILYYNDSVINTGDSFNYSTNNWHVRDTALISPPMTQLNSTTTNPYLSTLFDGCSYLNTLMEGKHYIGKDNDIVTNWNSDEFGTPDGTGAPYGNGHIVRYINDATHTISDLKGQEYGRYLPDPDSTSNHSTNLGITLLTESDDGASNNMTDAQSPLVMRIVGNDTVHTSLDMASNVTADYVAKVKFSIVWEISADFASGSGNDHRFDICIVPQFKIQCGKGDPSDFTVDGDGSGGLTHQERMMQNKSPYADIHGNDNEKNYGTIAAYNTDCQIKNVASGDQSWDDVVMLSYHHNVADIHHSEMSCLIEGEVSFDKGLIEDTDDIVFKIQEGWDANNYRSLELLSGDSPYDNENTLAHSFTKNDSGEPQQKSNRKYAAFTRFIVQKMDVVFYNPDFNETNDMPELAGNQIGLNLIWGEPTGSSSSSWSERSFKIGTTSVNYFDEESGIQESNDEVSPVVAGYAPEVCIQINKEYLNDMYVKKTKIYFKDNESDIWYLQFYIDHKKNKLYSTTSGKSENISIIDAGSGTGTGIAQLFREDMKDFNEVNSYESETMVSQEDAVNDNSKLTARYQTSVVANNRLYVGNIMQGGKKMGDRMLKSPIGKYNLLPASNFIDVAINDGDEITGLAYYKDKLLQFKKRKVFVINTSGDYEFLEDTFHDIGVRGQCSVATTPNGVVWVNKNGCYLYNGEKLINLIEGILSTSDAYASSDDNTWAPFPDNGQKYVVGYIEDKDSILVSYSDKTLSTALPSAAIYHFQTKSWTPLFLSLSNQESSDTGNFSNFITDNNGDVLYYHHKSGRETLGINEIKKWHHNAIQDSDYSITTKHFGFTTKDITFDSISSTKNLYRVYITYKVKRDGIDSAVAVTGAVNGTGTFNVAFDAASTFQGTSTVCYGSSTLDETDGKWKTAELKFATPSEVKGINSFQLQITALPGAFDFEINDISIEYRTVKRT